MKKFYILLIAFVIALTTFAAGEGNKLNSKQIPEAVVSAFKAKYPTVQAVSWFKDEDAYAAKFYHHREPYTSRFNSAGEWLDATRKLSFGELRTKVQHSFSQGRFAGWQAHEVNEIEQRDKGVQYRIHIRNASDQSERYIYYDENGKLRKEESI